MGVPTYRTRPRDVWKLHNFQFQASNTFAKRVKTTNCLVKVETFPVHTYNILYHTISIVLYLYGNWSLIYIYIYEKLHIVPPKQIEHSDLCIHNHTHTHIRYNNIYIYTHTYVLCTYTIPCPTSPRGEMSGQLDRDGSGEVDVDERPAAERAVHVLLWRYVWIYGIYVLHLMNIYKDCILHMINIYSVYIYIYVYICIYAHEDFSDMLVVFEPFPTQGWWQTVLIAWWPWWVG